MSLKQTVINIFRVSPIVTMKHKYMVDSLKIKKKESNTISTENHQITKEKSKKEYKGKRNESQKTINKCQ